MTNPARGAAASEAGPDALAARAESAARRTPWRRLWLVGVLIYLAILWWIGWRRIEPVLASIDARLLLATAAVMLAALAVRVLKWRLVLAPEPGAAGVFFLAKAGGDWSPGRMGELAPLMLRRFRTPRIGAWIITDRLLEMAATLGLGALGILGFGLKWGMPAIGPLPEVRMYAMLLYVAAALVALVAIPAILLTRRGLFLFLADRLARRRLHRLSSLAALMADVSTEIQSFGALLPMASALTFLATALDIVVGMLLYRTFGYTIPFMLLAVVQCAHALASAFPFTPNATGVPYLVAAGLLYRIAGVPDNVLATSIGVSFGLTNLVFWSAFLVGIRTIKRAAVDESDQGRLFDRLAAGDMLYEYDTPSLERLNALVPSKGTLLDVGCGDGAIAGAFDAPAVIGFDISPRCARLAGKRGVRALVADARTGLPFPSEVFDTVYCIDVLHHLPPAAWPTILAELYRVLRPEGRMALVEPDASYAFVRLTQSPTSPIRVAPCADEPAIDPGALEQAVASHGFTVERRPIQIDGRQVCRSIFPLWQRLLKAPFVIALALWHGGRPNKFVLLARKPPARDREDSI